MLTEVQDRDVIVSTAIGIASAAERDAYIARVCGDDAALRREVEEMVAAHLQSRKVPEKPTVAAASAVPPGRNLEPASPHRADPHGESAQATSQMEKAARKYPRGMAVVAALLLLAVTGGSIALAIWASQAEKQAQTKAQEAVDERKQAQKVAEETQKQRDDALTAKQTVSKERDEAVAAEKAAQDSVQDTKAVLAFFNGKVLSTDHPLDWTGGQGKDVTLRQAVNAAESKVAEAFADRPLAESSIRETLGATYLDLGEAERAVKQYERALALREALQGEEHPDTSACRNKLAVAYRHAGRTEEASRLYDQNLNSPSRAAALAALGSTLLSQKKLVEAELKLRECLNIRQKIQPDDWSTFDVKSLLGEALLEQKKYADAEPLLLAGYEGLKQREAKIPSHDKAHVAKALQRLKQLYEAWGQKDKAARWQKELESAKKT
ncbi:MAG TPA: tetratricopeptide repeat protein [Gemmataceae bacterium]|jgi:tetratricopeptide (TPR) repeat protein